MTVYRFMTGQSRNPQHPKNYVSVANRPNQTDLPEGMDICNTHGLSVYSSIVGIKIAFERVPYFLNKPNTRIAELYTSSLESVLKYTLDGYDNEYHITWWLQIGYTPWITAIECKVI